MTPVAGPDGIEGAESRLAAHAVILASASPRRLDLLRGLGLSPRVVPARVDERPLPGEDPRTMVLRLAERKGRDVHSRLDRAGLDGLILAADTAVVLRGSILGKPRDGAEAACMLRRLSGRSHEVLTGVFLLRTDDRRSTTGVVTTRVRFRDLEPATIAGYVASGEPLDKAGAYGIQGEGAHLVAGIEGSWSNVVGLPLEELPNWLRRIGIELPAGSE